MKKTLLIVLFACIGLISCEKEVYVPSEEIPNQTILLYVNPADWVLQSDRETYSVRLPVSDIDRATFENDDISMMISRGDNDVYDRMPFTDYGVSYQYDITPGFVTLYIQNTGTNQSTPEKPNYRTRVKIVLVTSSL